MNPRLKRFVVALFWLGLSLPGLAGAGPLFRAELELPPRGLSQRVTQRFDLPPGETHVLFEEAGPASILHWWMTCTYGRRAEQQFEMPHEMMLRFYYDGSAEPAVAMTVAQFFSILLGQDVYQVNNAAIKVLPKNSFNCYLPMPFQRLRITLENVSRFNTTIWFMADWQQYPAGQRLTPLRLRAVHRRENPAPAFGSYLMADFAGEGFVAGMVQAVVIQDRSDAWYHSGGDLVLLDGETAPRAIRGIGGEDVFNMSFGIWPVQTDWVGAPYLTKSANETKAGSGNDGVMYRIFGPDPIWFSTSAVLRFGSKANDLESVIYAYVDPRPAPTVLTPAQWALAGPFSCTSYEEFQAPQWAEQPVAAWPARQVADFAPYLANLNRLPKGPTEFAVPVRTASQHAWCDFAEHYRGRMRTNNGAQPAQVSAYAVGEIEVPAAGNYVLHLGFDDWMRVWINGRPLYTGRHDHGFRGEAIPVTLPAGKTEIRVKLSNQDNFQWRLWAFSLRLEPAR